ncbi:helix-turn-helix domain-containing protein [Candidatus Peregrinibacteria bacterium]|nr:helix-turn-helix domain-containing protein [Candidatus Peregrinibacteria bacterium]
MKRRFTEETWRREPWFKSLAGALRSCKTDEDMANFLRDIGTLSELQAWSERLEVARMLARGMSYRDVARVTGASTTTVTRVAKFIENGEGGYRKFLNVHRHHRLMPQVKQALAHSEAPRRDEKSASVLQKYLDKK